MRSLQVSEKELNRQKYLEQFLRKKLTFNGLIKLLKIGQRQTYRVIKKYKTKGLEGIIHKNRGRPGSHKIPVEHVLKAKNLLQTRYIGFGSTFAAEKLQEEFKIHVSVTTIRRLQKELGLWTPKRKVRKHRLWRQPKEHFGEMAQCDGSLHRWFLWSDEYYTLLKFVDDATNQILWAEFTDTENYYSVMMATINYFKKHGKPVSIYVDCGKVFRVNLNNVDGELLTQYQRALKECGVALLHAHSPQAKGRIERSFSTDQDRLIKEMTLANITSIEQANAFLQDYYIPKYNALFGRKAIHEDNLHTSIDNLNLDNIFCIKEYRTLQNDFTVRYKNKILQVYKSKKVHIYPKERIGIFRHLNGELSLWAKGKSLNFKEVTMIYKKPNLFNDIKLPEPTCSGRILPDITGFPYNSTFVCDLGHFHRR